MTISPTRPECVGFLLIPGFSMMALTAATEPLRAANEISGRRLYEWRLLSVDGAPVRSSSDFQVICQPIPDRSNDFDLAFVVASSDLDSYQDRRTFAWLRKLAVRRIPIGALSNGALVLARAGLLGGYRCTIHWERLLSLVEEHPECTVERVLYCIDRNRMTAAGGVASLDLMLALIADKHGHQLTADIADNFLHGRLRNASEAQRMDVQWRHGVSDERLTKLVLAMEANISNPLSTRALAGIAETSERQLERIFGKALGASPAKFYMELRLKEAHKLLTQSTQSITAIALACGFSSSSHLGQHYRARFGATPSAARANPGRASRAAV
ncbi:MAG: GlxA family transcriptional regulator [Rhizobiales bacterium]|nr:GlxA family transcriptional regulator [Hyphomicrobiales bacterium]